MTPKEKAKQLIDKIWIYSIPNSNGSWNNAKQCALICVDEIINNNNKIPGNAIGLHTDINSNFWEQVKQEIQNI